ncbi:alpha/beta hydrolase [Thalassobaculum sp. OXR-137]|uniref:alpha/beta hydrolase n=1 Tax=Thalassobaculum sp. OXR-137 TaxID=3100173 RepID=UPI002AC8D264|nr:alpha/beta hydrolase [Thalassobaculum sp. OXR-137]WPZ35750.1 alpha/beta hydrolase [Thalassobaculum sp. OXR-137]
MTPSSQHGETPSSAPRTLATQDGETLAYHHMPGREPGILFCGGFMSDMTGTKALALEALAQERGQAFTRFDYRGHGQSSGAFRDGTIGKWTSDALAILDAVTSGPVVVVGSSMGGWIALLLAIARPQRMAGLVGIAAAPDFTEDLMWAEFDEAVRQTLITDRVYLEPSEYSEEPYTITMDLIEEGRNHLIMRGPIPIRVPVRLLHGMRDTSVPHRLSLLLAERLETDDVQVHLVKDGDHRLSTDRDIALLAAAVAELSGG